MERKSSIHIEAGNLGYLFHNDRTKPTANSIFSQEKNEYFNDAKTALEIYRQELQKRSEAYTKRTGKKPHKNAITHLSAIVNLDKQHTLQDVKKIAEYLEQKLGTKVFQISIHKDEGYIDEETGEPHINYHAHLEFMGLDEQGNSIRRKLDRKFLINLQDKVAEILQMERGVNYTAERRKRPKRLDTYEYKEHARRQAETKKELLAKVKDLKEENRRLREELKKAGAQRAQYAELEAFVKQLKEQIKSKELTIEQLKESFAQKEQELLEQIQELENQVYSDKRYPITNKKMKWREVAKEQAKKIKLYEQGAELRAKEAYISDLEQENEQLQKEKEEAEKKVEELEKQVYSPYKMKSGRQATWEDVAKHYITEFKELKPKFDSYKKKKEAELEQLQKEKEEEKKRREKAEQEAEELKQENIKLKEYIYTIGKALQINIAKPIENLVKEAVGKVTGLFKKVADLTSTNKELKEHIEEIRERDDWSYGGGWKL